MKPHKALYDALLAALIGVLLAWLLVSWWSG